MGNPEIILGKEYIFVENNVEGHAASLPYNGRKCTVQKKAEKADFFSKNALTAAVTRGGLYEVVFSGGITHDVYGDELKEVGAEDAPKPETCKFCGDEIDPEDDCVVVNAGIPGKEFVECEFCHSDSLDTHRVIICEGCGRYFSQDALHDEEFCGQSFCACPHCGKDVVEGLTREEFEQEYGKELTVKVEDEMTLELNNQWQIVLEQAKADGCVAVTVWGAPDKDGIKDCEAEYTINAVDFVSMLNWYRYQKEHGNEDLKF